VGHEVLNHLVIFEIGEFDVMTKRLLSFDQLKQVCLGTAPGQ
jgi:hypothetical protein